MKIIMKSCSKSLFTFNGSLATNDRITVDVRSKKNRSFNNFDNNPTSSPPSRVETPEYFVNATLDPYTHNISAIMRFKVPTGYTTVSLSELYLNIWPNAYSEGSTVIHSVYDGAGSPLIWEITGLDLTKLRIELPAPITPDQEAFFTINFTDVIPRAASRYGWWEIGKPSEIKFPQHNAGNWLPVLAIHDINIGGWILHPSVDKSESAISRPAYFDVNITVPEDHFLPGLIIAASGSLVSTQSLGNGWTTWLWQAEGMIDFVFSAAGSLGSHTVLTTSGVKVTSYFFNFDKDYISMGKEAAVIGKKSIELFSKLFGEYPYPELRIVATHLGVAGMEYPGIIFVQEGLYRDLRSMNNLEKVITHEVGHEWFGYFAASDPYEEPWMDEAWAMYCTQLYYEFELGGENDIDYLSEVRLNYMAEPKNPDVTIINHSMDFWLVHSHYYSMIIYDKGMLVVNMFRHQVGNETFFDIMREYFNRFGFKNPQFKDLLDVINDITGELWDDFFEIFLNSPAVIPFRGEKAWLEEQGTDITLKIRISQAEEAFIPIWMPIRISYYDGTTFDHIEWMSIANITVELKIDRVDVKEVRIDPEYSILDDMVSGSNRIVPYSDPATPTIDNPEDVIYEEGTIGHIISWNPAADNPDLFTVTRNGIEIENGSWIGGEITINIDGLTIGMHTYVCTVYDVNGRGAFDTVMVQVVDVTAPTIDHPEDLTYEVGTTGHSISWTAIDNNPNKYTITNNGNIFSSGFWVSGTAIEVKIDGLAVRQHVFIIIVTDVDGNSVKDTVIVTVTEESFTTTSGTTATSDTTTTSSSTTTISGETVNGLTVFLAVLAMIGFFLIRKRRG
ncbi:MAG: M1 family aminopeptidase [Candidatus Hodarchaeales archaeon]|jgi:hypothetical protein